MPSAITGTPYLSDIALPEPDEDGSICMDNEAALQIAPPHNGFSDSDSDWERSFGQRLSDLKRREQREYEEKMRQMLQMKQASLQDLLEGEW